MICDIMRVKPKYMKILCSKCKINNQFFRTFKNNELSSHEIGSTCQYEQAEKNIDHELLEALEMVSEIVSYFGSDSISN